MATCFMKAAIVAHARIIAPSLALADLRRAAGRVHRGRVAGPGGYPLQALGDAARHGPVRAEGVLPGSRAADLGFTRRVVRDFRVRRLPFEVAPALAPALGRPRLRPG